MQLQALTTSELVHLLKADVLQTVTDEQNGQADLTTETEKHQTEEGEIEQFQTQLSETIKCDKDKSAVESNSNDGEIEIISTEQTKNEEQ